VDEEITILRFITEKPLKPIALGGHVVEHRLEHRVEARAKGGEVIPSSVFGGDREIVLN